MKKEIFALLLLAAILTLSVLNIGRLTGLCDEVTSLAEQCSVYALNGDWDGARGCAEKAVKLWLGSNDYTHIVLHHGEIDAMSADLYSLSEAVFAEDAAGVRASAALTAAHLESIADIERIRLGSIF